MKELCDCDRPYFSCIATACNCWRQSDTARRVYETCLEDHGPEAALAWARRIPPSCVTGRWLSIDGCEEAIERGPWHEVSSVLTKVLAKKADRLPPPLAVLDAHGDSLALSAPASSSTVTKAERTLSVVESESIMSTRDHMVRVGRWSRDTIKLFQTPSFKHAIVLARKTREPLKHFMLFLQKKLDSDDYPNAGGSHLCALTCGKI